MEVEILRSSAPTPLSFSLRDGIYIVLGLDKAHKLLLPYCACQAYTSFSRLASSKASTSRYDFLPCLKSLHNGLLKPYRENQAALCVLWRTDHKSPDPYFPSEFVVLHLFYSPSSPSLGQGNVGTRTLSVYCLFGSTWQSLRPTYFMLLEYMDLSEGIKISTTDPGA